MSVCEWQLPHFDWYAMRASLACPARFVKLEYHDPEIVDDEINLLLNIQEKWRGHPRWFKFASGNVNMLYMRT